MSVLTDIAGRFHTTETHFVFGLAGSLTQIAEANPARFALGFAMPFGSGGALTTLPGDTNGGIIVGPVFGLVWLDVKTYANMPMLDWFWFGSNPGDVLAVWEVVDTEG